MQHNRHKQIEANYTPEQADTIAQTHDSAVIDTALSVSPDYTNQERQEFVDELELQLSENYDLDARFEAIPEKPHPLDKAKNYVGTSIDELKAAFNDGRFGRAALAGAKVALVVGGAGLVGYVLFGNVQAADAAILPTDDLPSSSDVAATIDRPAGETWYYTGGSYDINDPTKLIASRNDGIVEKWQVNFDGSGNVTGATSLGTLGDPGGTGYALQDIVAAPGGYVGVAGTTLYFFDSSLAETGSIDLTGVSDLTDAHVYITLDSAANVPGLGYAIVFSTYDTLKDDDIRRVTDMSGGSVKIADGDTYSVGGMDLLEGVYLNDLMTKHGEYFFNIDGMGNEVGGSTFVDMNNFGVVMGDIFGKDYFAEVQFDRIDLHNALDVQDAQIFVPGPATFGLLALGGGVMVLYRRRES